MGAVFVIDKKFIKKVKEAKKVMKKYLKSLRTTPPVTFEKKQVVLVFD